MNAFMRIRVHRSPLGYIRKSGGQGWRYDLRTVRVSHAVLTFLCKKWLYRQTLFTSRGIKALYTLTDRQKHANSHTFPHMYIFIYIHIYIYIYIYIHTHTHVLTFLTVLVWCVVSPTVTDTKGSDKPLMSMAGRCRACNSWCLNAYWNTCTCTCTCMSKQMCSNQFYLFDQHYMYVFICTYALC